MIVEVSKKVGFTRRCDYAIEFFIVGAFALFLSLLPIYFILALFLLVSPAFVFFYCISYAFLATLLIFCFFRLSMFLACVSAYN